MIRNKKHQITNHGLSLIEVVVATLLVGLVMVGALRSLEAVVSGRMSTTDSARAMQLAQQLMSEILSNEYTDPTYGWNFGAELGEATGDREDYEDVDDYLFWSASPPENRKGQVLENSDGWTRSVLVVRTDPDNPSSTVIFDRGVKRITVTVKKNGETLAQLVSLRSDQY